MPPPAVFTHPATPRGLVAHRAFTLQQAIQQAPALAQLGERLRRSAAMLADARSVLPPALRPAVQAGPVDGSIWCLLADSSAAAARLRQLTPALLAALRVKGHAVESIRVRVHLPGR